MKRIEQLPQMRPFREFTDELAAEHVGYLERVVYAPGHPRYICAILGALHEELAERPELQRLVLEATWMARRMNAARRQDDLDWGDEKAH